MDKIEVEIIFNREQSLSKTDDTIDQINAILIKVNNY